MNSLYHLSFRDNLEGYWEPRCPVVVGDISDYETTLLSEPSDKRISVSPSIEQCFQAIYPNVSKYFTKKNYPYMIMSVYSPEKVGKHYSPEILTNNKYVWDAFYTEEHWLLEPTYMLFKYKVKIWNTDKSGSLLIYPYNDNGYDKVEIAPATVEYEIQESPL